MAAVDALAGMGTVPPAWWRDTSRLPGWWRRRATGVSFLLSLFASTTLGAGWYLSTRTDVTTDLLPWLGPSTVTRVWTDPDLLRLGFQFSIPLLLILLCHELGHYVMCRRYSVRTTPPYFLPAPVGLGTFGAFIRIREPIRDKRQLLDIGVAGPIAGFVALIPFLLYGTAQSHPPRWRVARADTAAFQCEVAGLYGSEFVEPLSGAPSTAFVADGSAVVVNSAAVLS